MKAGAEQVAEAKSWIAHCPLRILYPSMHEICYPKLEQGTKIFFLKHKKTFPQTFHVESRTLHVPWWCFSPLGGSHCIILRSATRDNTCSPCWAHVSVGCIPRTMPLMRLRLTWLCVGAKTRRKRSHSWVKLFNLNIFFDILLKNLKYSILFTLVFVIAFHPLRHKKLNR